jgi:uncharacterized protein (DUF2141 family)
MRTRLTAVSAFLTAAVLALPTIAYAADVVVRVAVAGPKATTGRVGCSLFAAAKGFPLDISGAQTQWQPAGGSEIVCRFSGVTDGTYAVGVLQDLNGNNQADTNVFGAPTEPWGVSNNIRHRLRAPRFEEAAFRVTDGRDAQPDVRVEP